MDLYFKGLLDYEKSISSICYSYLTQYEQKIMEGLGALNAWYNNKAGTDAETYLNAFLAVCSDSQCADAITQLGGQVTGYGGSGCDLTVVLY